LPTGYIEFRISGKKGDIPLTPESFDISEIQEVLANFERVAFPGTRKGRPIVSYEQLEGSVRTRFKTKAQVVLAVGALLAPIKSNPGLEILEIESARGIESLQRFAKSRNYEIEIFTSFKPDDKLVINKDTDYRLTSDALVEADFYLYGEVSTIGGKQNPSIKIDTANFGVLTVKTNRDALAQLQSNMLYKIIGVHAKGKQNLKDFEIDRQSLELVSFLEYAPSTDRTYLESLIRKASSTWSDITDPDSWLDDLRGGLIGA
jgi:hypothetical protein